MEFEREDDKDDKSIPAVNDDDKEALSALEKCNWNEDSSHNRRLIKETITVRRKWIESEEVKRTLDIVTKFPHLKSFSMIMYEIQLLQNVECDVVCTRVEEFLDQLTVYYESNLESEVSKAHVIDEFHNEITLKKFLQVNEKLFTISEGGKSTKELQSAENSSPRAVLYTIEGVLASGFIVADGSIKVKIAKPTVSKVTACLVAVYYTWSVNYPTAYKNTLDFLDFKLFNSGIEKKQPYKNLIAI